MITSSILLSSSMPVGVFNLTMNLYLEDVVFYFNYGYQKKQKIPSLNIDHVL